MRHHILRTITVVFFAVLLLASVVFLSRTWADSPLASGSVVIAPSPTPTPYSGAEKAAIEIAQQHLKDHAKEYYLNKADLSDLQVSSR